MPSRLPLAPPSLKLSAKGCASLATWRAKNIFIDYRWAKGTPNRFPALADELINLRVDVIVTQSNAAVAALQRAT